MANELFSSDAVGSRREFGRIYPPNLEWLERQEAEPILEPDPVVIDPRYHVLDLPGFRYLAAELTADLTSGHRVEASVFVDAQTRYRPDGPEALRPVGETEFVARMSSSVGTSGNIAPLIGTGIVGFDFDLADALRRIEAPTLVLEFVTPQEKASALRQRRYAKR